MPFALSESRCSKPPPGSSTSLNRARSRRVTPISSMPQLACESHEVPSGAAGLARSWKDELWLWPERLLFCDSECADVDDWHCQSHVRQCQEKVGCAEWWSSVWEEVGNMTSRSGFPAEVPSKGYEKTSCIKDASPLIPLPEMCASIHYWKKRTCQMDKVAMPELELWEHDEPC